MKRLPWIVLAVVLSVSIAVGSALAGELTLNVLGQPIATGLIQKSECSLA